MKKVTVKEVMDVLKNVPEDCAFTVWKDGIRQDILDIDDSLSICGFIELNLKPVDTAPE